MKLLQSSVLLLAFAVIVIGHARCSDAQSTSAFNETLLQQRPELYETPEFKARQSCLQGLNSTGNLTATNVREGFLGCGATDATLSNATILVSNSTNETTTSQGQQELGPAVVAPAIIGAVGGTAAVVCFTMCTFQCVNCYFRLSGCSYDCISACTKLYKCSFTCAGC